MSDAVLRGTAGYREPAPRVGERRRERAPGPDPDDAEILHEARERHRRVVDWESDFRAASLDDIKFNAGDSENHWQWHDTLYSERGTRPSLTVNKTRQHCLQVVNDAKQNKPQIRVTPVSDEATKASADVFEGIIRHIEYASNAQVAYDTATEHQVQGGIGWWRVITEYEDERSFNLVARIRRIRDCHSVWMDPDIQEADGSDANFAFIVDDVPRDMFEAKYPEYRDRIPQGTWAGSPIAGGWLTQDHVRVAEYFRRSQEEDTLHHLASGHTVRESEIDDPQMLAQVRQMSMRERRLLDNRIEWFKIVGGEIVDRNTWPGKYIPLVRVIGEETVIEGRLERRGHVRALKDPQRIYNYWSSSAVEYVALQTKTPYVAAAESIEGFQALWDEANVTNRSVLPYNARDENMQPLPDPKRIEPPQMPQAYIQGLQIAQSEMSMATGQYQPTMGQPSKYEISGKAIQARQRQGDTATYHFVDNLAIAIRFTGRILIDLIPKIYDTPRIMRIMGIDGTVDSIQLDPTQQQALRQVQTPPGQQAGLQGITPPTPMQQMAAAVTRIFNPNVGTYEVQADVGPAYATKRQEAFNAFTQIVQTAPQIMGVAGDLLFKAADFPMAEELAERLQRMVPPQALGQGPSPVEQNLQTQLQGSQAHVALLGERLAVAEMKLRAKDASADVDAYKAVTDRMGTLLSMRGTDSPFNDGSEVRALVVHMVQDALRQAGLAPVSNLAMNDLLQAQQQNTMQGQGPPPPGGPIPGMASGALGALAPQGAPGLRPPGVPPPPGAMGPPR